MIQMTGESSAIWPDGFTQQLLYGSKAKTKGVISKGSEKTLTNTCFF